MAALAFKFGPASPNEQVVFGAKRPGHASEEIQEWISFMKTRGIKRVCCLLPNRELNYYAQDLLTAYREEFGLLNICWAPIADDHLCDLVILRGKILAFLKESNLSGEPVVVHCAGGSGRTGHVLAAWLVFARAFSKQDALSTVRGMGRNPHEAVECGNATPRQLDTLLEACEEQTLT